MTGLLDKYGLIDITYTRTKEDATNALRKKQENGG